MFSEISTPRTQARAFSFFAFSGNLGIFFGPLIGGGLSNPVDQYPSTFGHSQFFKDYPYALATLVSGLFAASAALVNFFFLKEVSEPRAIGYRIVLTYHKDSSTKGQGRGHPEAHVDPGCRSISWCPNCTFPLRPHYADSFGIYRR